MQLTLVRKLALPLLVSAMLAAPAIAGTEPRPRIAIVDVRTNSTAWASAPAALGDLIGEMLMDAITASGRFRVIDPAFQDAAREPEVHYVLTGTVVRFSTEAKKRTYGGLVPLPIVGGVRTNRTEAVVEITLRLVATGSGEVASSATGRGTSSRKGVKVGILTLRRVAAAGGYGRSAEDFRQSILGEATRRAVDDAARQLLAGFASAEPPDRQAQSRETSALVWVLGVGRQGEI